MRIVPTLVVSLGLFGLVSHAEAMVVEGSSIGGGFDLSLKYDNTSVPPPTIYVTKLTMDGSTSSYGAFNWTDAGDEPGAIDCIVLGIDCSSLSDEPTSVSSVGGPILQFEWDNSPYAWGPDESFVRLDLDAEFDAPPNPAVPTKALDGVLVEIMFLAIYEDEHTEQFTELYKFVDDGDTSAQGGVVLASVPLPAALPLMATALAGLGIFGWRRRRVA
jgi:hypothetical protein